MSDFVKDGWEFSKRDAPCPYPGKGPQATCGFEYSIKHPESGVEFRFGAFDALRCHGEELKTYSQKLLWLRHSLRLTGYKRLQAYVSPLLPAGGYDSAYVSPLLPAGGYDSAYAGRMRINDLDSYAWEDIDLETLHEQIVWATENQKLSDGPYTKFFNPDDAPASIIKKRSKWKESKEGPVHPLLNFMVKLYSDHGCTVDGSASCYFHLVVIDSGWFVCLRQVYGKRNGARREREMTMQCNFMRNIIYREIIERQSKHFNQRHEKDWRGVRAVFHEAKQLKIQEIRMRPDPFTFLRPAKVIFSEGALAKAVDVSDYKVESLFSNCGKLLKFLESETGTRIQIVPLSRHPCKLMSSESMCILGLPGKAPTTAYICGLEKNFEYAESCLKKLLSRNQPEPELCIVGNLFSSADQGPSYKGTSKCSSTCFCRIPRRSSALLSSSK